MSSTIERLRSPIGPQVALSAVHDAPVVMAASVSEQASFVAGEDGVDHCGTSTESPDGAAGHQLAQPIPFALGQIEQLGCRGYLFRWLAEQHAGLDVRQQLLRQSWPPRCRRRSAR